MLSLWHGIEPSFRVIVESTLSLSQVLHLAMNPEVEARKKMASDSLQAEVEELRAKVCADSRPFTGRGV